jgi:hypothetical protein
MGEFLPFAFLSFFPLFLSFSLSCSSFILISSLPSILTTRKQRKGADIREKTSFGAVVEEFELHDAMAQILAEREDTVPQLAFGFSQQQISAY